MRTVLLIIILLSLSGLFIPEEIIEVESRICPNCTEYFLTTISSANNSLYCALYDISHPKVLNIFDEKDSTIDVEVLTEEKNNKHPRKYSKTDTNFALMHNKFCIIDEKIVITGSANPTINGFEYNDNILIKIHNEKVAEVFLQKFSELHSGGSSSKKQQFETVDIYFCPEDNCRDKVISEIRNAKKAIFFATFVFTDKAIATELILAKQRGVYIQGVIENRMYSISVGDLLQAHNISVAIDTNPKTMHHKLFIFDNNTVLTGSYNPTKNGNLYNDETMIIIRDYTIAKKYTKEISETMLS